MANQSDQIRRSEVPKANNYFDKTMDHDEKPIKGSGTYNLTNVPLDFDEDDEEEEGFESYS